MEVKLEQEEGHMKHIRSEQREKDQAKLDAKDRLVDAENNTKKVTTKERERGEGGREGGRGRKGERERETKEL